MFAQDARVARGERVFSTSCSVPYCHGPNGTAGRAPKLAGHGFTAQELTNTVSNGIPNKGMPAFAKQLSSDDLGNVIAYVASLRGSTSTSQTAATVAAPAPSPGKALFFDATRMGGCSKCHEMEKRGSPVASTIRRIPADLRAIDSDAVTVLAAGESPFPAIVFEQTEKRVRVFDLSSQIPVLRTFAPAAVKLTAGSTWKHQDAIGTYNDADLREIATYLRSIIK
jgi:cytochrome c553